MKPCRTVYMQYCNTQSTHIAFAVHIYRALNDSQYNTTMHVWTLWYKCVYACICQFTSRYIHACTRVHTNTICVERVNFGSAQQNEIIEQCSDVTVKEKRNEIEMMAFSYTCMQCKKNITLTVNILRVALHRSFLFASINV